MKYRADIDGLRAVAVLPVVFYHAGLGFPGGFVGVDVFFVISGFLITSIIHDEMTEGRYSILRFYERRIRRIFPALFVMMAATLAAGAWFLLPMDFEDLAKSALWASVFLSNVFFESKNGYFMEAAELFPLLHTWSLAVEEQFYVVFPLILMAAHRFLPGKARLLGLLGFLAVLSFVVSVLVVRTEPEAAFYLTHTRFWELLAGSILAIALHGRVSTAPERLTLPALAAGLGGLALIAYAVFTYSPETLFPGAAALPPVLGAVLLIWAGAAAPASPVSRLLALPPLVFVGSISYSLYLWHWPVLVFAGYGRAEPLSTAESLGAVALSVLLAWLSLRLVETPVRTGQWLNSQKRIFAAATVGTAALAIISVGISSVDGFDKRLEASERRLLAPKNFRHDRRECHRNLKRRKSAGDYCTIGDGETTPVFVLVGDSHADAISPAIHAAATATGVRGYQFTAAGFRPMPGVSKKGNPGYVKRAEEFSRFLRDMPDVRTVILSGFWSHQMTGNSYREKGSLWYDDSYDGSGSAYSAKAAEGGLARLFEAFPDRRFILLDDNPTGSSLDLRTQMRILWRNGEGTLDNAAVARADYAAERATYEPVLQRLAERYANVDYRPVFSSLCDEVKCALMRAGEPVWRDGDHLSAKGAMLMEPQFREVLATIK